MATVEELIERTHYLIDDQMDATRLIALFNECLEDLSPYNRTIKKVSGVILNGSIPFPEDYIKVNKAYVTINNRKKRAAIVGINEELEETDMYSLNDVYVREVGTEFEVIPTVADQSGYELYYYPELPSILTTDENGDPVTDYAVIPPIAKRYHRLLSLYAAVKYFENWEGNPELRNNYNEQYQSLKLEYAKEEQRKEYRNRSRTVSQTRSWLN